jgi:hypothetical protein
MGFLAGVVDTQPNKRLQRMGGKRGGSHAVRKSQVGGGSPTRR